MIMQGSSFDSSLDYRPRSHERKRESWAQDPALGNQGAFDLDQGFDSEHEKAQGRGVHSCTEYTGLLSEYHEKARSTRAWAMINFPSFCAAKQVFRDSLQLEVEFKARQERAQREAHSTRVWAIGQVWDFFYYARLQFFWFDERGTRTAKLTGECPRRHSKRLGETQSTNLASSFKLAQPRGA
ncbi:hypothetical protein K438DRAFT_1790184 [Mycena galopus ATCC 62051]|nr:hypothetical protein K438DRAFT_1790184 [Mycena galopus ATCC 62051]